MTDSTRSTVEDLLGRMAAGDADRAAALFAEPVDWQLTWPAEGHPSTPWIRPRSTRADVADHFRSLREHHVSEADKTAVTHILVDGPHAVVLGHIVQTPRGGSEYTSPFALHLTVEEGLITRYHVYEDSLTVLRAHDS